MCAALQGVYLTHKQASTHGKLLNGIHSRTVHFPGSAHFKEEIEFVRGNLGLLYISVANERPHRAIIHTVHTFALSRCVRTAVGCRGYCLTSSKHLLPF